MGYSPAFAARLRTLKSEFKPDIIHADSHAIGVYAKEIAPEPAIWFLADDDVLYLERRYRKTANSRSGLQLRLNIQARRRFLRRYLDPFSSVFFVADEDRATFLRDFPQMDVRVAANGIDLDRYPFLPETRPVEPASLLFTGNFVAPHNVDASLFFLRGVWPLLIKRYPNLCYYAAGANPPDRLREWHDGRRIHITGFVPSLQPYFERASVYVGSIVSGSGMLNKLQEAMAYGVPVVCTSIAARGLRLRHNDHVLVGDSPEEIASHVIRVLDKPAESRARAHRARRYMEEEYSWRTHVDKLESAYADALSGGRTAAGSGRHPCRDATSPSPSPSPS
jgi:glycosyltransferase involved in cell wall biosynthesis